MEEVLQGVRGMRQSMLDMHRTRAQASFSRVVGSALRGLAAAVDDTLEATSRRSALLPASILACCHRVSVRIVSLGGSALCVRACVLGPHSPAGRGRFLLSKCMCRSMRFFFVQTTLPSRSAEKHMHRWAKFSSPVRDATRRPIYLFYEEHLRFYVADRCHHP